VAAWTPSAGAGRQSVGKAIDDRCPRIDCIITMRSKAEPRAKILRIPPLLKEIQRGEPWDSSLPYQLVQYALERKARQDGLFRDREGPAGIYRTALPARVSCKVAKLPTMAAASAPATRTFPSRLTKTLIEKDFSIFSAFKINEIRILR